MRRIAYALSLVAILSFALGACASGKATGLPAEPTTPPAGSVCTGTVDMKGVTFVPAKCTVKVGTTVDWTNGSDLPHTVTAVDEKIFDSGATTLLQSGDKFDFKFTKAGTYPYYCRLHAPDKRTGMVGTIVVEAA